MQRGELTRATGLTRSPCGKGRRYPNQLEAEIALSRILMRRDSGQASSRRNERRAHPCVRCGGWHLTSEERRSKTDRGFRLPSHIRKAVDARDGFRCVACGESLAGVPFSRQHRLARRMGGSGAAVALALSNLLDMCGSATSGHHGLCEARDPLMHAYGYWLRSGDDPRTRPVRYVLPGGLVEWRRLDDDGGHLVVAPPTEVAA